MQKYVSPDGILKLLVLREDNDLTIGFEGYSWHTHGDILPSLSGLTQEEVVRNYVDDILKNRAVIGLSIINGSIVDVWVSDEPEKGDKYKDPNEIIVLRYWDGTLYETSAGQKVPSP